MVRRDVTPRGRDQALLAFSLGLARQALPLPGGPGVNPLAVLALVGQLQRFTLPAVPDTRVDTWRLPDDPAVPLPDSARASLLRLMGRLDAITAARTAPLLLVHVAATGHRLHPFDLPQLTGMLAAAGAEPGPVGRAWLDRDARADAAEASTPETWLERASADQQRFLHDLRQNDPAAARTLLEAAFATRSAKARAELLQAMAIRLGPDDRPFLAICAGDRVAAVREVAKGLLARLPGSPEHAARLDTLRAAVTVQTKGVLRRRELAYRAPVRQGRPLAPIELLDGFGLIEVAAALEVAADVLPAMDDPMRLALAGCALRDGDAARAADLLRRMEAPVWPGDVEALGAGFAALPPDARQGFAADAFPQDRADVGGDWHRFGRLLGAPLWPDTAARLLGSPGWARFVTGFPDTQDADAALLPVATLIPAELALPFADGIAGLPAARRPRTTLLVAFLTELDALPAAKDLP